MRNKILIILGVLAVMGAIAGGIVYANLDTAIKFAGMAVNYIKYLNAPAGTTVTELAPGYKGGRTRALTGCRGCRTAAPKTGRATTAHSPRSVSRRSARSIHRT